MVNCKARIYENKGEYLPTGNTKSKEEPSRLLHTSATKYVNVNAGCTLQSYSAASRFSA